MTRICALLLVVFFAAGAAGAVQVETRPTTIRFVTPQCDREEASAGLSAFVSALARGRVADVDAAFAQTPDFKWYSSTAPGTRNGLAAYRRETLLGYFRARVRKGERLSIVNSSLRYVIGPSGGVSGANGYLYRRATDLRSTRFGFKFALVCGTDPTSTPKLIVWSMARAVPLHGVGRVSGSFDLMV